MHISASYCEAIKMGSYGLVMGPGCALVSQTRDRNKEQVRNDQASTIKLNLVKKPNGAIGAEQLYILMDHSIRTPARGGMGLQ